MDGFASLWEKIRTGNSWVAWLHGCKDNTEVLKVQLHGCMKIIDKQNISLEVCITLNQNQRSK